MKYIKITIFISLTLGFSGCSMMPGKSTFSCNPNLLKNAGVCKNAMYILKNKELLMQKEKSCSK